MSTMVGFNVKPDSKYMSPLRVNRVNNVLATVHADYCEVAFREANGALSEMFKHVPELSCSDVLKMSEDAYKKYITSISQSDATSSSHVTANGVRVTETKTSGGNRLPVSSVTLGYELFTDMVKDTCDRNQKITRDGLTQMTKALLKVACNVDQSTSL